MTPEAVILALVVTYLLAMLAIGTAAARLTRSPEDFFLAGRSLGAWVTAISSTAASESGWVVLGFVGMAYTEGAAALWTAPGCLMGYWINLYWLAPRLRRETAARGSLTLPDFLEDRFGGGGHLLRVLSVLVIFASLCGYVAAQMTATGKAMAAILDVTYAQGILIGGAVIVVYTFLGGFRAVSWTDFVQGLIMAFALVVMPLVVLFHTGGYGAAMASLAAADPDLVTLAGGRGGFALFGFMVGLLGIGLGYPGQPHVITRYMAASGDEEIRRTQVIAMVWGVFVFYGAGLLGMVGRLLMPGLKDPEQLFPLLSRQLLHPALAGVMLAAILSAIMSTVSSQLLVAASSVSHDLMEKVFGLARTGRASLWAGRASVVILGGAAALVALQDVRVVFWFVLFAWSGLGAAFGPLLLLGLTTERVTRWGALAGVVTGFGVTVAWKLTGLSDRLIYELVPAFFLSALAVLAFSALERALIPGGPPARPA